MKNKKLSLKREKDKKCTTVVENIPSAKSDQEISPSEAQTCSLNSDETLGTKELNYINRSNSEKVCSELNFDVLKKPIIKVSKLTSLTKQLELEETDEDANKILPSAKKKRSCPSCNKELALDEPDHWKDCLQQFRLVSSRNKHPADEDSSDVCFICRKNVKHLNLLKRTQHLESCLDKQQNNSSAGYPTICPFCRKNLNLKLQPKHLKQCAKRFGIEPHKLKDAIQLLERQAEEREAFGLSTAHLQTRGNKINRLPRNENTVKTKNLLPRNEQEADLQMAMALSVSLQEKKQDEENREFEELGFPTCQLNLFSDMEKKKKGQRKTKRKENAFSLLLHRTSEDRQRIVNENVAQILGSENERKGVDHFLLNKIFSPSAFEEFELVEKENLSTSGFVVKGAPLWNLAALPCDNVKNISDFYVEDLHHVVTPNKVKIGRFKRLSQIPGRGSSQPNTERKKFKLEYEDFVASTQEALLAASSINGSSEEDHEIFEPLRDEVLAETISISPSVEEHGVNNFISEITDNEEIDIITVLEENPSEKFASAFNLLLDNEHLSDVNFITKDDCHIPAHSILFYARCPILYQEIEQIRLNKSGSQKKVVVEWPLISRSTAIEFFRFIYTNQVQNITVPRAEILFLIERYNITLRKTNNDESNSVLIHKEISNNEVLHSSENKNNKLLSLTDLSNNSEVIRDKSCILDCVRTIPLSSVVIMKQSPNKDDRACIGVKSELIVDQQSSAEETKQFENCLSSERNESMCNMNVITPRKKNAKNNHTSVCIASTGWQNNYLPTSTPLSNNSNHKRKYFSISSINSSDVAGTPEWVANYYNLESYKANSSSKNLKCTSLSRSPMFFSQVCNPSLTNKNVEKKIIEESVFESASADKILNEECITQRRNKSVSSSNNSFLLSYESNSPDTKKIHNVEKNINNDTENCKISNSSVGLVTPVELFTSPKFNTNLKDETELLQTKKNLSLNENDNSSKNVMEELQNCDENMSFDLNKSDVWEGFNEDGYIDENSVELFDPIEPCSVLVESKDVENNGTKVFPSKELQKPEKALDRDIRQLSGVKKKKKKSQKERKAATVITPKPDYNLMKTPEISEQLKKYGIRKVPRKKAVVLLEHIYENVHPWVTDSEQEPSFLNTTQISPNCDGPTQNLTASKMEACESHDVIKNLKNCSIQLQHLEESDFPCSQSSFTSQDSVLEESILFRSDNDLPGNREKSKDTFKAFYNYFVSRKELYTKMLHYQPLDFNEIHAELKDVGIKHSEKTLLEYLDKKGIAFTMHKGNWKKRRLKKVNSSKVKRRKN